jgi:tetratricopeptide (TPR) repeat protein
MKNNIPTRSPLQGREAGLKATKRKSLSIQRQDITSNNPTPQEIQALFDQFAKGNFVELEDMVRKFIKRYPTNGFGWKVLGVTLKQLNMPTEALQAMQQAVSHVPTDIEAHRNLRNFFKILGKQADEEKFYINLLKLNPHCHELYSILGEIKFNLGKLLEAKNFFIKALESKKDSAEVYNKLGSVYLQLKNIEDAIVNCERATYLNPSYAEAFFNLGIAYKSTGQIEKANQSFRSAISITPDYAEAHLNLGNVLKEMGRKEDASTHYKKALQINPLFSLAYYNLGVLLQQAGYLIEAEKNYNEALNVKSDYAEASNNLGVTLFKLGRMNESEIIYRRTIEINPFWADPYANLAITLKGLGRLEEAETCCKQALQIDRNCVAAHNALGTIYYQSGRLGEAIDCYSKALAINPDFSDANNNLASALTNAGNDDQAVYQYHLAIKSDANCAAAYFNLHALLLHQADAQAAVDCMAKAVGLEPTNPEYRFFLGLILDYFEMQNESSNNFKFIKDCDSLNNARLNAWKYIKQQKYRIPMIGSVNNAFRLGFEACSPKGMVLEFGVRFGSSIRQIASFSGQIVHGFDSFQGLPEAWHNEPKGSYTTRGVIPDLPENVRLHVGWFEDTLPSFLAENEGDVRFINIDCDIYSSTSTVLNLLAERIVPGTVIVFDEYIGNEHWQDDEFKAFQEAVTKYKWTYKYIGFSFFTKQVIVLITETKFISLAC